MLLRRDELSGFAVLRRRPARVLMIVIPTLLTVAPTPFRQSFTTMTTDPSTQVTVPVGMGTAEPRECRVARPAVLPNDNAVEVVRSDDTAFVNPLLAGVGLGMQKQLSLQSAHAQPYPHAQL